MPLPTLRRTAVVALAASALLASGPRAAAQGRRDPAPPPAWADVRVEFEGTRAFPAEQLKGVLQRGVEGYYEDGAGRPADLSRKPFHPELLDHFLKQRVVDFMRDGGYLRAQIGEVRQEQVGRALAVTVPVEEGEFFRLGEVRIEGAEHFAAERLRAMLPLKRGDVASGPVIVRWLSEHLAELYGEDGFVQYDYEVEPRYTVEPGADAGVADFLITVSEGRRFVVRRVGFDGPGHATEESLRAALGLKEGEVFSRRKLREGLERLDDLDLFDRIDVERDVRLTYDEEAGEVEVKVYLSDKPDDWPTPGGGR